jgi:hypothetical protein
LQRHTGARGNASACSLLGDETARHENTRAIFAALAAADMATLEHEPPRGDD